jgi:hypothetical protein
MTTVTRTFTVTPAPQVVIDYLKDFGHTEEWDPGTRTCTRNDSGPIVAGSSWHNVSKIHGITAELTYTLKSLEADQLVFERLGNEKVEQMTTVLNGLAE